MTAPFVKQLPISVRADNKSDVRTQFAALCYRVKSGKIEVLLITSRGTGRWIVPKGWPMDGQTPAQSAMQEAWEEAGVVGKAYDRCLGLYSYTKVIAPKAGLPCVAMVYPVAVKSLQSDYPEAGERRRKWFSQKKAAQMLQEPELARIVRDFDPKMLR
ncbi:hypothetical protein SuNHUV7_25000 (plasmid) [Pseudoseohaeicola sp. NH-UV-7]|uniref:NUDIX hydrolase n=1 Tax=unclassified Sulfitobacter TaxID=196795 RepID=UPI000E09F037|nr:NUDIX hydrolase [Sulfitobacter sp. JL08]AXI55662.1 NUDIX hydrolase [Sulfitobacter sp. JL08]